MNRRFIKFRQIGAEVLPLLVAMLLVLRVIATPIVLSAPEAGQIALCLNGQITYVDWDGEMPDGSVPHSDPCPFFGVVAVVEGQEVVPIAPWRALVLVDRPEPAILLSNRPVTVAYLSRAPPRAV